MRNAKIIPAGFGLPLVLVLLAAAVGGVGQWWAEGASTAWDFSRIGELAAAALEAGFVEEVLFRGVLLWGCLSWAQSFSQRKANRGAFQNPVCFAIATSSLVFGLFHLLPDGPWVTPEANLAIALAQAVQKVAQATLFGIIMARLVFETPFEKEPFPRRTLALAAPIVIHVAFDLLYLGPPMLSGEPLPTTYLTGIPLELANSAGMTLLLSLAVLLKTRRGCATPRGDSGNSC